MLDTLNNAQFSHLVTRKSLIMNHYVSVQTISEPVDGVMLVCG